MVKPWIGYTLTIIISILIGWLIINPFLAERSAEGLHKRDLEKAISYNNSNAEYHYLLGLTFESDLEYSDPKRAIESYRKALRLNPLNSRAWTALARAYEGLGMEIEAEKSLSKALLTDPANPDIRWEAGIFYLLREKMDKAFENLRVYLLLEPERQNLVYDLTARLSPPKGYVLKNLIPPSYNYYKTYLSYLISHRKGGDAREVWKVLSEGPNLKDKKGIEKGLYLKYIDFLISESEYNEAQEVWMSSLKVVKRDERQERNRYGNSSLDSPINAPRLGIPDKGSPTTNFEDRLRGQASGTGFEDKGILWNGGFERDIIGGGFDWRTGKAEGVKISIDNDIHKEGSRSLYIAFDGGHNPDLVAASQVVLLKPGTSYILKGYIKTDNLTTTNGIFIEITGHNCKGLYKATGTVTGTNFWREVYADFRTPPDCYAGVIKIRRARSTKFNNKIGGSAWVDKISLQAVKTES